MDGRGQGILPKFPTLDLKPFASVRHTFRIYHFERSIEKASQHYRFLGAHDFLNFRTGLIHVEACLLVFALADENTCRAQAVIKANQGLRVSGSHVLLRQWLSSRSETQMPVRMESSRYIRMLLNICWAV